MTFTVAINIPFPNGLYLGAGWTEFQYSDDFDEEFHEYNFYAGWSNAAWSLDLEYSGGDYNGNFLDDDGTIEGDDYDFLAVTGGWNGVYLTYGVFGEDAEEHFGEYFEFGYGFEVAGFDVTAALVFSDTDDDPADLLDDGSNDGDETQAYVSIHRSFDIMKWGSGS